MSVRTVPVSLLAALCIAAVLLAGCTTPSGGPVPSPTPSPAMTPIHGQDEKASFREADNGETYPVPAGSVIQLTLTENPTTGYRWNLSVTPGLALEGDTYTPDDPTGTLVGSGGTRTWTIRAIGEGRQVVTGFYERSWEGPAGAEPGYLLTLEVSGGTCGVNTCTIATTPGTVPARYHVYTMADGGKTVQESQGETFGIRLQGNPSTGYSWNLSLTQGLTLTGGEYIADPSAGRVGVGGVQSYTLVAAAKGGQVARAEYRRPWVTAGTVTYVDLEGGFYGITGDDGKRYDPLDLDAKYRVNGLRVAFEANEAGDTATIHMWGTPVNLVFIEEIPDFTLHVTVV